MFCSEGHSEFASVSVLVLTYGNYSGLAQTIDSILSQDYPIQKLIISDDGSGVPFPEKVIAKLQNAHMQVIVRANRLNMGTSAHMNMLAGLCTSKYLKFISAGDAFYDTDALKAMVSFAEEKKALIVTSNVIVCSKNLKTQYYVFPGNKRGRALNNMKITPFRRLALENVVSAVGCLIHVDFFNNIGGFDENYRLLEDWPTWLRLSREGYTIPFLNRITCYYTVGGMSSECIDAFHSKDLKSDMLRCYEEEILPHLSEFNLREKKFISYRYNKLQGVSKTCLLKKYLFLELRTSIKWRVKWCIFKFWKVK